MANYFVSQDLAALQKIVGSSNSVTAEDSSFLPFIKEAAEDRREYKERWTQAIEFSPIAICIVDFEGRFLEVNPEACNVFERSEEELKTLTWQEITHPEDIFDDQNQVEDVIKKETKTYRMNKRYRMPDGRFKPAYLSVSAFQSAKGKRYFISQIVDLEEMAGVIQAGKDRYGK